MTSFDFAPLLPADLPPAAARWTGLPKYNFTGGNNDGDAIPLDGLGRRGQRGDDAGRALALDLRPRQRPAGLPAAARFPGRQAQARRRHRLRRRRHPGDVRLAAGARPGQRHAAVARRHRAVRAGVLRGLDQPHEASRRDTWSASRSTATACAPMRWRRRSPISRAAASGRSTSTPFRRCRTRPAPSCRRRAASSCCGCRRNTACRSSRTTATPT